MSGTTTLQRVWKNGETICVTVPKDVRAVLGIEVGDYLEINWIKVVKKDELKGEERVKRSKNKKEEKVEKRNELPIID